MYLILLILSLVFTPPASAKSDQPWTGTWKIKRLICPFDCSQIIKDIFDQSKDKTFEFSVDRVRDPMGMGIECESQQKPDYSKLTKTTAKKYLDAWSDNEQAQKKPNLKRNLAKILGIKPKTKVTAGLISCGRSQQNFIFVGAKRSFALYEENAYLELSR